MVVVMMEDREDAMTGTAVTAVTATSAVAAIATATAITAITAVTTIAAVAAIAGVTVMPGRGAAAGHEHRRQDYAIHFAFSIRFEGLASRWVGESLPEHVRKRCLDRLWEADCFLQSIKIRNLGRLRRLSEL